MTKTSNISKLPELPNVKAKRDGVYFWTDPARLLFPSLIKPKAFSADDEPEYQVIGLFPSEADMKVMKAAFNQAARDRWESGADAMVKKPKFKDPFMDQGTLVNSKTGDLYDGAIVGAVCIRFKRKASYGRPCVFDIDNTELLEQSDIYSGMWARIYGKAYAWVHPAGGVGVNFGLEHVQKLADDTRLGGSQRPANDVFEALERPQITGTNDADPTSW